MPKNSFLILGHRGARSKTHFQNSLSAFREALNAADGFETDTAISKDGVIYLVHDITFIDRVEYTLCEMLDEASAKRVGARRLDQMDSTEIDALRLKNGEPIPRLTDALALFRGKPNAVLNLELKSDNTAGPVVELLRRTIAAGEIGLDQIVLSSFNLPALLWARQNAPEFKLGALFALETQKRERLYPWGDNVDSCYMPFDGLTFDTPQLRAIAPDFFNLSLATMSILNIASIKMVFPEAKFIAWSLREPYQSAAPHVLDMLLDLANRNLLYAWITDEPRLRKDALLARI